MGNAPLKALDLFCGGGGAAIGLYQAGFDTIVGIDNKKHRNYPFDFIQADATELPVDIHDFDFVWASPPCQRFSVATRCHGNDWKRHPDFMPFVREALALHPWTCIENVPNAPLRKDVILTGRSMGLPRIDRKRVFETSFFMLYPKPIFAPRRDWEGGFMVTVTKSLSCASHYYPRKRAGLPGNVSVKEANEVMGIPSHYYLTGNEIGEAVPPPYSRFIAEEAIRQMQN